MDLAAIALPAGFRPDGLPFGVSLIAPALSDAALIALGERFLDERAPPHLRYGTNRRLAMKRSTASFHFVTVACGPVSFRKYGPFAVCTTPARSRKGGSW